MENMNKSYKEEELIKDEDINISDSNVYKSKSFANGSNQEQSFFSKGLSKQNDVPSSLPRPSMPMISIIYTGDDDK